MRHGSFYSGMFDGFSLAATWMGWRTVFQVEQNKLRRECLKALYPNSVQYESDEHINAGKYRGAIDIISGGDPCQPSSTAGRRLGKADPRYRWPIMFRNIKIIGPRWVVNENVGGTISNGILDQKVSDLESEGYSCWPPLLIPASAAGAIHERERVFLVAHSSGIGLQGSGEYRKSKCAKEDGFKEADWIVDAMERNALPLLCSRHDGLPNKVREAINWGAGDSIVPQVIYGIFQEIARESSKENNTGKLT